MISISRQHTYSAFGPCSSPLYYTALSRLPTRLVFAGLTRDSVCRIVLSSADSEAVVQRSLQANPENGVCIWPLTEVESCAEMLCTWRIEESDLPGNKATPPDGIAQGQSLPREGRFRVLNAESRDRLKRGRLRLGQVCDHNSGANANALFMAEFGLYHEALLIVEAHVKSHTKRNSLLLARTVQAMIYKQMLRQIEQEQQAQTERMSLLDWYSTWTVNRERYYRELSIALMKGQCPRRCLKEVSSVL